MVFFYDCLASLDLFSKLSFSRSGPEVIKLFSCSTQLSTEFQLLIKLKYQHIKKLLALCLTDFVFIMLINVEMPIIFGIICRINLCSPELNM